MEISLEWFSVTGVVFALLTVALACSFVRLALGPGAADRVIALELISVIAVGMISVYNISAGQAVFLDAAIAFALIGFLSMVAIARYLERTARHD